MTNLIASLNTASQATGTQPGSRVGAAKKLANAFEGSMYEMMVNTHSPSRGSAPGMSGSAVGWRVPSKAGAAAAAVAAGSGGGRMGGTARAVAPTKRGSDDDQFKFIQVWRCCKDQYIENLFEVHQHQSANDSLQ